MGFLKVLFGTGEFEVLSEHGFCDSSFLFTVLIWQGILFHFNRTWRTSWVVKDGSGNGGREGINVEIQNQGLTLQGRF